MKSNKVPGIILGVLTIIVVIWGVGYLISNEPSEPYRCQNDDPAKAAGLPTATLDELRFYDGRYITGRDNKRQLLHFTIIYPSSAPYGIDKPTHHPWVHLDPEMYKACESWKEFDWETLNVMFKDTAHALPRAVNTPEDAAKETPLTLAALRHYDGKKIANSIDESCLILIEDPDSEGDYRWIHMLPNDYNRLKSRGMERFDWFGLYYHIK